MTSGTHVQLTDERVEVSMAVGVLIIAGEFCTLCVAFPLCLENIVAQKEHFLSDSRLAIGSRGIRNRYAR